jgi:two-component system chemotaxis response regulator CheB
MVLIGVSTGGPNTLATLLPALPANLGVPILIVQHMPPLFTQSLAENLASKCALKVREAVHDEVAEANTVYIAPGGHQMRIAPGADGRKVIQITDDPPENNCRPAVDYLFRSAASHFPGRSLAVILTGMGSDGTLGLRLLKRHGCHVIAQDEATSVVWGMPKAAVEAGVADVVLPLDSIAGKIASLVRGGVP